MKKIFKKLFIEYPKKPIKSINKKLVKLKLKSNLKKRITAPLTDLKTLSFDIPELITDEIFEPNDFYYIAHHLKKYIGRESSDFIKAAIEHGLMYSYHFWDAITNHEFQSIITLGEIRRLILEKICPNKNVYTIGPFINYVEDFFTPDEFQKEKEKLGKNLLVFPAHSTHHMGYEFDHDSFCEEILKLTKDFDSTTICLYWKDIHRGYDKIYQKFGFNCVCAGHIYDPYFLPRLKTIIKLSDYTASNVTGTHIGYSLFFNKPHYLIKNNFKIVSFGDFANELVEQEANSKERTMEDNHFYNHFSNYSNTITKEQWDFANQYFGFDQIKTKEELKTIIETIDKLQNKERIEDLR